MDKLLTYQGGQPFALDDFNFMDATFRSAINAILKGLVNQNCIITGCETQIIDGQLHISDGFVYLDNEIFYCPQQNLDYDENKFYVVDTNIYDDPNSLRTFKDGSTHHVWQRRQAKVITVDQLQDGHINVLDYRQRMEFIISSSNPGPWIEPELEDGWEAFPLSIYNIPGFRYRFLKPNELQLFGGLRKIDNNSIIMHLPDDFPFEKSTVFLAIIEQRHEPTTISFFGGITTNKHIESSSNVQVGDIIIIDQIISL